MCIRVHLQTMHLLHLFFFPVKSAMSYVYVCLCVEHPVSNRLLDTHLHRIWIKANCLFSVSSAQGVYGWVCVCVAVCLYSIVVFKNNSYIYIICIFVKVYLLCIYIYKTLRKRFFFLKTFLKIMYRTLTSHQVCSLLSQVCNNF